MFFKKKDKKSDKKKMIKMEPVTVETRLGTFQKEYFGHNPDKPLYSGPIDWCGSRDVEACIVLDANAPDCEERSLCALEKILSDKEIWDKRLKEYLAEAEDEEDGRIAIWGSSVEDEEPDPITKEEFISRLSLSYIRIYEDQSFEFVFPADDMFMDHDLIVRVSNHLEIEESCLEG